MDTDTNEESKHLGKKPRKVKITDLTENFLKSAVSQKMLQATILKIEQGIRSQNQVNNVYEQVIDIYQKEVDRCLPKSNIRRTDKKRRFIPKPWWTDELSEKWRTANKREKEYLKCISNQGKKNKREAYKQAIKEFDRLYRKLKREYFRKQGEDIEQLQSDNPQEFWKEVAGI